MWKSKKRELYQKESYVGFYIWLACTGILLFCFSFWYKNLTAVFLPLFGTGNRVQILALLLFGMMDLLCLLMLLTQRIYWTGIVSYEKAREAGTKRRVRYALRQLILFLAGTAVFLLYRYLPGSPSGAELMDAICAGACFAAASVLSAQEV